MSERMNEKMKILEMLEKGKITSEEAIKLLEAVESSSEGGGLWNIGPLISRVVSRELKRIPEIIRKSIEMGIEGGMEGMKYGFRFMKGNWETFYEEKEYTLPYRGKLEIENMSGDTEISGEDREDIAVSLAGEVKEEDDVVKVKNYSADTVDCHVPERIDLRVSDLAGDTYVEGIKGNMELSNYAGDVEITRSQGSVKIEALAGDVDIKGFEGEVDVEAMAGDVNVEYTGGMEGRIKTLAGGISLKLLKEPDVRIVVRSPDLECPETIPYTKKGREYIIGDGEKTLYLESMSGDVSIKEGKDG